MDLKLEDFELIQHVEPRAGFEFAVTEMRLFLESGGVLFFR